MYFFKRKGRQVLDLRGNLILTHNPALVRTRVTSAAPTVVQNVRYISILGLNLRGKIAASRAALAFIWTRKLETLDPETSGGLEP